jgi:hypothetical protein
MEEDGIVKSRQTNEKGKDEDTNGRLWSLPKIPWLRGKHCSPEEKGLIHKQGSRPRVRM